MSKLHRRHFPALITALALSAVAGPALAGGGAAAASASVSSAGTVAGHAGSCEIVWGSLPESAAGQNGSNGVVTNVRSGRHECFDRLVVDVADVPGSMRYDVRYVDAVRAGGSGDVTPLRGGAFLQIGFAALWNPADAPEMYDPVDPANLVPVTSYDTFRQVALAGTFEGNWTIGLGVRARLPFRVFELDGPDSGARLVIDVAHHW